MEPSYISRCGILKYFGSGSCRIRASKGSSVVKPRSSFLGCVKPCKTSKHLFISRNLRSISASLARYAAGDWGDKRAGVDPSFDWVEGEHLLVCLESWTIGGTGFPCLTFGENESRYDSKRATPKGAGVCGGMAGSVPGDGVVIGFVSIAVFCIARTTAANS